MKNILKRIKARWNRFWHCLGKGLIGHRMITETIGYKIGSIYIVKETIEIGCECGKTFYRKSL